MNKNLHDIDKLFGDAINEHEEVPSLAVWEAIDKSLDKKNITDIKRKYVLLKGVAAGLLILLIGAGIINIQLNKKHKNILEKNEETINNKLAENKLLQSVNTLNNATENLKYKHVEVSNNTLGTPTDAIKKDAVIHSIENVSGKKKLNKNNYNKTTVIPINNISEFNSAISSTHKKTGRLIKSGKHKITISPVEIDEAINNEIIDARKVMADKNEIINYIIKPSFKPERVAAFANKLSLLPTFATSYTVPVIKPVRYPFNSNIFYQRKHKSNNTKNSPFSITAFFAPNIPSFRLENDHDERRNYDDRRKIKEEEQHQHSFSFGLLADYSINNHWAIQSGLTFIEKKINIQPKKLFADKDNDGNIQFRLNCSSGYAFVAPKAGIAPFIGDSIQTNSSTTHLQYSSIPLSIKYSYSNKKITLFGVAGTALNFLSKGNIKTEIAENSYTDKITSTSINGLKSSFFNVAAGLGVEYNIFRKFALTFMPTYNFALTSITQNSTVKSYPNSLSLAAGLHYRF